MTERARAAESTALEHAKHAKTSRTLVRSYHEESTSATKYDSELARRLWEVLRPQRRVLLLALLLMPLGTLGSVAQPLIVKRAIDAAIVYHDVGMLGTAAAMFLGIIVFELVVRFPQTWLLQLAGQRAMRDLRSRVFSHIQQLRVGYFDRTPVGRVVTRVTNDVDALGELFASGAVTAVADVLMLLGIVGVMLYLDWRLSLLAFAALPPVAVIVEVFRRRARVAFRAIRAKTAQLNAYLAEQVQGTGVVQAFEREADCLAEYRDINQEYREANRLSIKYDALLYSVVEAVAASCIAIVLWYAGSLAGVLHDPQKAAAYVGTVVAFYEFIQRFFVPIRDLSSKYTMIQSAFASAERIFGLLDTVEPDAVAHAVEGAPAVPADVAVAFREVVLGYGRGEPALRGVTFDVKRGESVAIVGPTGAGKTSMISALLRLYDIQSGHLLVDGRDVRTLSRTELRRLFAVVPQDVYLFAGTIFQNVALGDEQPDAARAQQALERVGAWAMLERRGLGLDARVAERGGNFSAGERQLIAFARALYRDPPFVVLDEATANIDSETEAALQRAVAEVLAGRTAIVIAHRLSTIRRSSRILVMHHGIVAEQGTHEELVSHDGLYRKLHDLQMQQRDAAE